MVNAMERPKPPSHRQRFNACIQGHECHISKVAGKYIQTEVLVGHKRSRTQVNLMSIHLNAAGFIDITTEHMGDIWVITAVRHSVIDPEYYGMKLDAYTEMVTARAFGLEENGDLPW